MDGWMDEWMEWCNQGWNNLSFLEEILGLEVLGFLGFCKTKYKLPT